MGMFDQVTCEMPLPDGYTVQDGDHFQTKSFANLLDDYRIREDGTLEVWRYNTVPNGVYPDDWHTDFLRGQPRWMFTNAHWELVIGSGEFYFYDYDRRGLLPLAPHDRTRWHEYRATFVDGRVIEIIQKEEPEGD